ncbi:zinc finger-containing protein [Culex quinquefasciatus]|uniref:Zinc finger-containing protein n=1 Tax=Culex quinquefasciatus TaxID=7176 RepID=B0WAV3_CULQU|nr:zinc finger-containing protein [Culex quinquefasciatus]|eukprot:XP_001845837.1 zinc finger-containing protein [Culex quinquefasciatus]
MSREVILIDDDYDQLLLAPQQQQQHPPQPQVYPGASQARGKKRTFNGLTIQPVQNLQQLTANTLYSNSDGTVLYQPPESVLIPAMPETIVGDSPDVFYIEELDEASGQVTTMQIPMVGGGEVQPVVQDEEDDEEPAVESIVPEEEVPAVDDYYEVEPLELSEIWNDLITANQEILILLELQDLKHHIVDARKIEDQLAAMTCDYCPKELPDVRAWNRHIKKIHFQTEIFDCDSCSARFKYYARFKDHLNSHSGQRPYPCDECDHHYATRIGFLVHKILEHMKLNGIYICPKCELDCKNAQNYKLHIAKHIDSVAPANGTSSAVASPSIAKATAALKQPQPQPFRPFQAKANEQNKFLNVFESFSAKRALGEVTTNRPKGARGRSHRV